MFPPPHHFSAKDPQLQAKTGKMTCATIFMCHHAEANSKHSIQSMVYIIAQYYNKDALYIYIYHFSRKVPRFALQCSVIASVLSPTQLHAKTSCVAKAHTVLRFTLYVATTHVKLQSELRRERRKFANKNSWYNEPTYLAINRIQHRPQTKKIYMRVGERTYKSRSSNI